MGRGAYMFQLEGVLKIWFDCIK